MQTLIFLVEQIAIGLYIAIIAGVVWFGFRWLSARRAFRATRFELERDIYRYQSANSVTLVVLLFEMGLVIAGIQNVVAPTVRRLANIEADSQRIITDVEFRTPTPGPTTPFEVDTSGVVFDNLNPSDRIFSTAVPTPTAVGTIEPNAPDAIGCDLPNATLQIPANGMRVFQIIPVTGTAFTDNFAFYKLEISGESTNDTFAVVLRGETLMTETGALGQFNPTGYEPGEYEFRLVVFDNTETLKASCTVTIYLDEPIPTPTPIANANP